MREERATPAPAVDDTRPDDSDLTIDVGWIVDGLLGLPGAAGRWIARERINIAIAVALMFAAAALRMIDLEGTPFGLHGDEAWTGLDARRILEEGWIGPYVESALGQPTGPLYFTALIFKIFGDSVWSIRFSMAVFGVAAIPLIFMASSLMFGRTTAVFAALLLLAMTWHLHLSRMGFMVISWPMMELLTLWLLWLAFKRQQVWLYALAGLACGLGVYTYNVYLLFVPIPFVALAAMFFYQPRERWIRYLASCAVFALTALLAASSMLRFINEEGDRYRAHQESVGVQHTQEWKDGSTADRIEMLWERGKRWHEGLFFGGVPDGGDGLSTDGHPPVAPIIYFFALAGLVMALLRFRRPEYLVLIAAVVLLPWGALLTTSDGMYRRTLGLAPFVAMLAAIPLARAYDGIWAQPGRVRWAALALFIVPAFAGVRAAYEYFGETQDDRIIQELMVQEQHVASQWMDTLPRETMIYHYSGRWSFNYETRRFNAPDAVGQDRSLQFRGPDNDGPLDYTIGPGIDGPVAFVFMAPYILIPEDTNTVDGLAEVQALYPSGEVVERFHDGRIMFQGYYLPDGP